MASIERFEDLDLWKDAVKMGVLIYKITEEGKMARDFGARDQLRRAAISVSNNIAEGFEYNNNKAFVRFLMYAKGSAGELRSQLFVLKEAGIIEENKFHPLWENALKLSRSIEGFRKYLRDSRNKNLIFKFSNLPTL
jgi:four helix bundle protein